MNHLTVDVEKRLKTEGKGFSVVVTFQTQSLTTVIFGPSGAGKTTLLRAVAGLLRPDRGRIALEDNTFFDSNQNLMLPPYRRNLGMVFQQPSLFPHMSALDNVLYAAPWPSRHKAEAEELLERFHVSHVASRRPAQLSGGEQQRVAIARALAAQPRLLLLDEPLPGVDAATRASVLADLVEFQNERQVPYLYVTHNRVEALRLGGHALLLDQGRIVAEGNTLETLSSPLSPEVANVLGADNVLTGMISAHHSVEGLSEIDLGGSTLYATMSVLPIGTTVAVTVPSADIILSADRVGRTSARNVISGRVKRILNGGAVVEVVVETPVPFRSRITRSALESLGLRPGSEVFLLMKATGIVVEPM
jgi:molybdate transport system ATP-binding protein